MATSGNNTLGLIIPTHWEAQDVLRHFKFQRAGRSLYRAQIGDHTVLACISGVGAQRAVQAAGTLVAAGANELVSMGFCGALVPELHVGDFVTDRMISVDRPARTPQDRKALTERANAIAVDMETRAVIEEGTRRGVPIHILRVISDEYGDDLTPLFGTHGSFSRWSIAWHLLNPKAWPLARKLHKQSLVARTRLIQELAQFCQSSKRT
jgi:nucleoside phosphorylase